jgi:flagellar biosynthesis/type III secretory pathway M-ring protein FliF/YscJ
MLYTIFSNVVIAGVEDPVLREGLRDEDVTPGILGFLATFAFVLVAIVVFRIMIRQIRRVKLRSTTAEDMLVERNQPHLKPEERQRSEVDELEQSQTEVLRKKYPGYLDMPTLEAKEPDSGRKD